jgi:hypothetical protein
MDWTIILNWILGGTSLAGIVGFFVYRKENKKLKENEVAAASVETQSKEIDLGKKYIEESVNVVKGIKSLLEANNADTAAISAKMDGVETRMVDMEKKLATYNRNMVGYNNRLRTIERFLNGNLKEFTAQEKEAKRAKKSQPKPAQE